jgi:membrane protein, antimicrobial resistance system
MAQISVNSGATRAPKSLGARFFGVITAPRATYEAIVAHPKWLGMLALTTVLMIVLIGGFLTTKVGQEAWLDAATNNPMSGPVSDQQYQAMEKMSAYVGYITAGSMLVMMPLFAAVLAGILFAVFNAALGGDASFKQIFTVVVHAGPIGVLAQVFTVPLNYIRGTMSSSTNLGVLTQAMLDDGSFAARLMGMIDIFIIWQIVVLAIGLAVLYRRRTQPIATTLLVLYAVIAVIVAFVRRGAGA